MILAHVEQGRVRLEDRLGNIEADAAADLGRRHQTEDIMDVRRAPASPVDRSILTARLGA